VSLDDLACVPDTGDHAFAGGDLHELTGTRGECGLKLPERIGAQALDHDGAHLLAQAVEAAELVEDASSPEKDVGIGRQFAAMIAELADARVRAVLGEITGDDAVLQHAA